MFIYAYIQRPEQITISLHVCSQIKRVFGLEVIVLTQRDTFSLKHMVLSMRLGNTHAVCAILCCFAGLGAVAQHLLQRLKVSQGTC